MNVDNGDLVRFTEGNLYVEFMIDASDTDWIGARATCTYSDLESFAPGQFYTDVTVAVNAVIYEFDDTDSMTLDIYSLKYCSSKQES